MVSVKPSDKQAPTFKHFLKWTFANWFYYALTGFLLFKGFSNQVIYHNKYYLFENLFFVTFYIIGGAILTLVLFFIFYSLVNMTKIKR